MPSAFGVSQSFWQNAVLDRDVSDPSTLTPANGDRFIVGPSAVGVWLGKENKIAEFNAAFSVWSFFSPVEGWTTYIVDEDIFLRYTGIFWAILGSAVLDISVEELGINIASAVDTVNFIGGVNVTDDGGGKVTIDIIGDAIAVEDGGVNVIANLATLNFGSNLAVTDNGSGKVTIDGSDSQNIWSTIVGDTGSATPDSAADTLTVVGGTGISTSVDLTTDTITITNDDPNIVQDLWNTIQSDAGNTTANSPTDSLSILGGDGVQTSVSLDALTVDLDFVNPLTVTGVSGDFVLISDASDAGNIKKIDLSDLLSGSSQNLFETVTADTGSTTANITTDTLTIVGGTNVTTAIVGDTLTIDATGAGEANTASNIGVAGVGVFKQKTGVDLEFKKINAGSSKVSITDDVANNEIDVDIVPGNILTSTLNNDTNWATDQNVWLTVNADTGTTAANTTSDALTVAGGTGISTSISGDILTVNTSALLNVVEDTSPQLGGQLDVNGFAIGNGTEELITFTETISAINHINISNEATGGGPTINSVGADTNIDLNLNAKGTGNIVLSGLSFPNSDGTINQVLLTDGAGNLSFTTINVGNVFKTIVVSGQSDVVADSSTDTLTLVAGTGVSITTNATTDTITITNTSPNIDQNLFETVVADTGSTTANLTTDTLTVAGGTNVTTTIVGDTLTIDATGGAGDPFQRTAVNATTYTIVAADTFIGVQHTSIAAVTITLPLGSAVTLGHKISIKDEGGNSSINSITVNRAGSDTIDGDTSFIFAINFGAIHVQWTGFEWSII